MALVKKRSRHIVVDGVTYRWRVHHKPTYARATEDATTPGTTPVVQADRPIQGTGPPCRRSRSFQPTSPRPFES
ncbi:hypothetical protein [Kitasatospora sp. NPDC094011]|uniref:hypothetical protein n=1 Tax=Kitasatospora sp. NPDC094011 TaxID=3364090 RepID=UPI0038187926